MLKVVFMRIGRAALVMWGVATLVFFLARLSGDPVALMVPEGTPPADIERLRVALGLDQPLIVQYFDFWKEMAQGNFGRSIIYSRPALDVVLDRLPATGQLAVLAMAAALLVAIPLGVASAVRPEGTLDRVATNIAIFFQATPGFVVGILLILFLSVQFGLLPTGGRGQWYHLIMPVITLGQGAFPTLFRITRSGMNDVIQRDYIRTAHAKGLPPRVVVWRHALRNAALPIVTIGGIQFGGLMGGAAIAETVFAWPGMGLLAIQAIERRDYPIVQTVLLIGAFFYVIANTLVDLLYVALDPRTRIK
jgi:peptide/nickel transport system permease protein